MTMKLSFLMLVFCVLIRDIYCAMTEAQMKAALKLIRNVCQPKVKATDEQIAAMHNGDWNQDKSGMCYMNCVLNYYKLQLPDNSFDWQTGIKTVEIQAPQSIREYAVAAINSCKDSVKTPDDKCRAGLEIAQCLYEYDPAKYFLP